jgi:hypothetical protein
MQPYSEITCCSYKQLAITWHSAHAFRARNSRKTVLNKELLKQKPSCGILRTGFSDISENGLFALNWL